MKRLTRNEESEILKESLAGNHERLVKQYWKLVHNTIRKTFNNSAFSEIEIEDIRSTIFLELIEKALSMYDPEKSPLSAFIVIVTTRRTLNYIRDRKQFANTDQYQYECPYDDENRLEARRKLIKIHENIEGLAPRDFSVFKLLSVNGYDRTEIASNLDISLGAVDAAISRIRKYCNDLIENE